MFAAMALGHVAIFVFGYGWLATLIGPKAAWIGGVVPFFAATAAEDGARHGARARALDVLDRRAN